MTKEEAAEFIEKSLLLNGYVLIPSGPDTMKIVTEERVPRSEGVPVILHPSDLPKGDQLVTYLMSLSNVPAEQVLEAFRTISPSHGYGEITVLPDGASLAITDNSAVIRRYIELQGFVDVPTAEQVTKSFRLERSDALEVVEQLEKFLIKDEDEPAQPSNGDVPRQAGQRVLAPTVAAIPRTNRVLVQAHPTQMLFVERLITELDAPSDTSNHITCALRYLPVLEFLPIAQDALNRGKDDGSNVDFDEFSRNSSNRQSTSSPFSTINQNGLSDGPRESLGEPTDVGGPRSLVVGHTLLIGDPTANELFASGPPEQLALLSRLIAHLDKKPRQIFLSTVIGQLTLGDNLNFGLDVVQSIDGFNVGGDSVSTAGSFRTRNAAAPILDPLGLGAVADFAGNFPTGLTVYGQIGDHISVILDALQQTSKFTVMSRPSVFTLNNEKAVIQTGQRIAVPVNTLSSLNTGTDNAAVASSIQFQDVVLRLEVIPLINSADEVTLQISQVNDDIIGSTVVSGNEIPTIGTQELRTTVIVPNKATILLGGLISEDTTDGQTGLPFLTRIPVVKHLSGTTNRSLNRQELLIFIQPQIVGNEEALAIANADTLDRTSLRQQALEFASSPQTPLIVPSTRPVPQGMVRPQEAPATPQNFGLRALLKKKEKR
tara:strand:- start:3583 stop:5556 length:1974 start_codon:yes stop_codon:yes gene_type:complete